VAAGSFTSGIVAQGAHQQRRHAQDHGLEICHGGRSSTRG
jgi:hypothetical protein